VSVDRKTLTVSSNRGYARGEIVVLAKDGERATVTVADKQDSDKLILTTAIPGAIGFTNGTIGAADLLLPASLQPPVISKLALGYTYETATEALEHCLALNDFVFEDHTEAARWPDRTFTPLWPVADRHPAVHFGFDRPLPAGLVSLYVDVPGMDAE